MAWAHGMASVNQTRPHCVNQMGKTYSKPLAARHGRGTAWALHAMCESAFTLLLHTYTYCGTWGRGTTPPALHSLTSHAIINHPELQNTRVLHACYNSSNRNFHVLIGGHNEANHCWSARLQKKTLIPTAYTGTHRNAGLDAYIES